MIPRIFISSTYYDLKHVRERLETFITGYGFEPILFENDKVTYQHGKPPDQSAYYEVALCQIMVLIIGGRYGSASTNDITIEDKRKYDEDFISVTRKEFEAAAQRNIPIMILIDKNVNSDYETYKENKEFFEATHGKKGSKEGKAFKFAHVDDMNVFRFIDIVRSRAVKTFEKADEIESYLRSQFSGLFYLYLESLKKKSDDNKILDTISELNNITLRMNEMLSSVGKKVLEQNELEYQNVIKNQLSILFDFYCEKLKRGITFSTQFSEERLEMIDLEKAAKILYENAIKPPLPEIDAAKDYEDYKALYDEITKAITKTVQKLLYEVDVELKLRNFYFRELNDDFQRKVLPFIKTEADEQNFIEYLKNALHNELVDYPFL